MKTYNIEIIEKYMKEHNLTKKQFASLCKLTIYQLNSFIKGKNVSSLTVYKISCATKIKVDMLLNLV